jgi:hypothetical protein
MATPTLKELEALVADPANAPLLARVLAAPSREPTPREREILAAFRRECAGGVVPMSAENVLTKLR